MNRILVPLDGSTLSEHIIETIDDVFGKDVELCIITVVDLGVLNRTPYLP
ncbi:MAG: hypothetical protein GWN18_18785, partial [Thermoplasmata archaeon]|nr:hypothetical protein [Thermoplasmata archaeon]NIV80742.1 hypothetical protein [Thermoplasmata archaeon]NIW84557.1 hypothetical protein [Thermoplasmata archaeon]NIW90873.1 hypothetical protein [Thermoplasmata archaeon]